MEDKYQPCLYMLRYYFFQKLGCQLCCARRWYSSQSDNKKNRLPDGPGLGDFIEASLNGESIGQNIIQKKGERFVTTVSIVLNAVGMWHFRA